MVTVPELADLLLAGSAAPLALLDVRWTLGEVPGSGRQRYAAGHLPGAAFLDLESALTRHTGDRRDGRHPLPVPAVLRDALAEAGVRAGQQIVVYDEPGSFAAGRAWWVLRWVGLPVRVLDGGLTAWTAAGHPLESGDAEIPAVPASDSLPLSPPLTGGHLPTLSADDAATAPDRGVLVDVRAPERFRGEVEPIDPIAGHIPGAINLPVAGLFAADGHLPDEVTLRERLAPALAAADAGEEVAAYCGSGVSAAQAVLALASLGVPAGLFPGSWSAWSNDPTRPVATGS
ncbi:MAG: sulfurtransferase [Actinomycetales bacterium]|uniref:Sulfurtransferase n=1 Tax=Candidatus Phosphoribacter hodrii TaxID=2953743 RepID=A0A9D7TB18_9MICO|nr:sulfurtransferase [Candidatus Phosphoribacter hodrii]